MAKAFPRFDGAAHWAKLDAEQQAEIGRAALEFIAGSYNEPEMFCGKEMTPAERASQAASEVALDQINKAFAEFIPREALHDDAGGIRIPTCVGMVCRACGCSDGDGGCAGGCTWAAEDFCSACALSIHSAKGSA